MVLLIYPPVSKPSEPPPGIAKLSGSLNNHSIEYKVLDANLEGLFYLLKILPDAEDAWTKRAFRNLSKNIDSLKYRGICKNFDRYKRAVMDINRLIEMAGKKSDIFMTLSDYKDSHLSPVKSKDLIKAAENPEINPFYTYFKVRFTELLEKHNISLIGFSLNYLSQALSTFAMIGFLKRFYPSIKLAIGGGLVTSWLRRPEGKNPFEGLIDYLVDGPGEHKLLSIMGKKPVEDNYIPDYSLLPMKDYLAPDIILPYSTSTGCYWNKCSFCPERAEKTPYKPIPADRVLWELNTLINTLKPYLIHLLDNAISPALLKEIIKNPLPVPWYGFTRIISHLTDIEFCMALKKSGCIMLKLGLESGSQNVLDYMQKGLSLEIASRVLKNLKKAGISTYIYLLFGTPGETLLDANKTREFIIKHAEEINFLNLAIFNMPIYGPEAVEFKTSNFYDGDLSLYTDFVHPKNWDRKTVRKYLERDFKRQSVIAEILKKTPPFFTSNHAPFFV
ncbi:MAG TPA: radical SAM protein [Candidatus Eremiobacteraeota bacterium]|nr:MAG: Radical SAM superfamily protein [bacterium ADurb.Bin363]HPZ07203.1 radical SAM protein [Candidatus Eremiobacteraeota bacterium]